MTTTDSFICPICGEDVPSNAMACPGCGADEKTGWNEERTRLDGLDLPDDDFNYDEFVKAEFGSSAKPRAISWVWWVAGVATTLAILYLLLRGAW
ncbi:MAG: zinc ribbon domain-containing protein [bacterium]